MGQLTNLYVSQSYQGLLKLQDSTTGVTGNLQYVQDGLGNNIPMLASTSSIVITGSFRGDGSGLSGITATGYVTETTFNSFTSSIDTRVDGLELATGSYATTSSLSSLSGSIAATDLSQNNRLSSLETTTGSLQLQINQKLDTGSFNTYTGSNDAKVNALINATGSYATTSSLNTLSGSIASTDLAQNNRLSSIETTTGSLQNQINQKLDTGSFNTFTASYYTDSGSFNSRIDNINTGTGSFVTTSSFNAFTASIDTRVDNLEAQTGSYATTGSNTFQGNQVVSGSLTVTGSINALSASITYLETIYQTSSVVYSSGSNIFGDASNDVQTLNGTVNIPLGNLNITGATTSSLGFYGNLFGTASYATNALSSSQSQNSVSSSFATNAISSSHSVNSDTAISSSFAQNAVSASFASNSTTAVSSSFAQNAVSSSHSVNSDTAISSSFAQNAISSSFATNAGTAVSSSFATNADTAVSSSYAQNADNAVSSSFAQNAISSSFATNAISSSHSLNSDNAVSSSFAQNSISSSQAQNAVTASYVLNAISSSFATNALSSSYADYAVSSSQAQNAVSASYAPSTPIDTGSFATTGSNNFIGQQNINGTTNITGALNVSGGFINADTSLGINSNTLSSYGGDLSLLGVSGDINLIAVGNNVNIQTDTNITGTLVVSNGITGSLFGTASYATNALSSSQAQNAVTASYVLNAVSASFATNAISSSHSLNSDTSISSSFAQNAISSSQAQNAVTASYVLNAVSASFATNAVSSSYALNATSASFATTSSIAYDVVVYGKCNNPGGLTRGTVVRIVGADGNNPLFDSASWTDDANSANTLGVLSEDVASNAFANVVVQGVLVGINTSGFTAGDVMFLSASGQYTTQSVPAPYHEVRLGQVLRVNQNQGSMYVNIDNGYELQELHDVDISGVTVGDVLTYISGSYGQWVNKSVAQLGYLQTGSFNSYTSSLNTRIDGIEAKTGSYATTGSNDFFGNQRISGSLTVSGSQTLTSGTLFIAANATGNTFNWYTGSEPGNLVMNSRNVGTSRNLVVSSSNNIILGGDFGSVAGAIYRNTLPGITGSNIIFNGSRNQFATASLSTISGSLIFGQNINLGGSTTFLLSTSSLSTSNLDVRGNIFGYNQSTTWSGSLAYRHPTFTNNYFAGQLTYNDGTNIANYNTGSTISPNVTNNVIAGSVTINQYSGSAVIFNANTVGGDGFNIFNEYVNSNAATSTQFNRNVIGGNAQSIRVNGSGSINTTQRRYDNNTINGQSNGIFSTTTSNNSGSLYNSLIFGSNLSVTASHRDGATTPTDASIFLGKFNETGSILNDSQQTIFALGTGTAAASRRTSLFVSSSGVFHVRSGLINSGSIELVNNSTTGSMLLSGSLTLTGSLNVTGSINSNGDTTVTGSVNISNVLKLALQNPLPAGASGHLAVSSSNELYFHNGTQWNLIS